MTNAADRLIFTDTRQWIHWGIGLGTICLTIAMYSFAKGLEVGIGACLTVVAAWSFVTALRHLQSGKSAVLELRDEDILFRDGLVVRYQDVTKVWAADPFPLLFVGTLNIALSLKPDAKITRTKRTIRALFFQSWVGFNVSLIRKKKMVSLMCPGLKSLNGDMDEDDLINEIVLRVEAANQQ
jgi:hypothetical protein